MEHIFQALKSSKESTIKILYVFFIATMIYSKMFTWIIYAQMVAPIEVALRPIFSKSWNNFMIEDITKSIRNKSMWFCTFLCRWKHEINSFDNGLMLPWWHHQMETFSALLAICAGNSPVPGEFPIQRPVTWSFDVNFDLRLNKWLSKQWWGWWF